MLLQSVRIPGMVVTLRQRLTSLKCIHTFRVGSLKMYKTCLSLHKLEKTVLNIFLSLNTQLSNILRQINSGPLSQKPTSLELIYNHRTRSSWYVQDLVGQSKFGNQDLIFPPKSTTMLRQLVIVSYSAVISR